MDDDGEWRAEYSIIDADVTEREAGLALIQLHLVELGCPPGTLVQYDDSEDRWGGARWHRGEARSSGEDDQSPWREKD